MKQLAHPITLKKCHFCDTPIEFIAKENTVNYPDDKHQIKTGLIEYKCMCGKAKAFADLFDMSGKSTLRDLEIHN